MLTTLFPRFYLNKKISRPLIVASLATMGVMLGIVPSISEQSFSLSFQTSAYAQEFTDQDILNYARAILDMESLRQQAYDDIKQIIGTQPPTIACNDRRSLRNLPRDAEAIAVNYCNGSRRIVQSSGLSVSQFNEMTARVQSDSRLKERVQQAMIRLQRR
ncbi:MAG: DUF4168 domain-containing protein [Oscillatoria sp. PMC 1051.18]|uniref:DUF4168 domain-containing protein n=1 Tax=Oscillatoria salina TaxID=331517 RepID=UPI0013BB2872|nr:DUF4168 domain-containing protein [Oscillatoria salina]MBZ8179968.1 DUF4168 domain-containing protein [Oscillatoria salina IIICB1]MEC4895868.1 DUF4168 domain-containing protein [Oscillatoria sp. PMC 1050.18]MEC5032714.1 DUF4168 domain-containing protein [Oscillatoria sp. PMC 1051.18]NET86807.1 DUF4168 domain-containing protein [Kamptonema sp. SIO1D9]